MTCVRLLLLPALAGLLFALSACTDQPDAGTIINRAIQAHGGEAYENNRIRFRFRDAGYSALYRDGSFTYTRTFPDSLGGITDSLTNKGFWRTVDGERVVLSADDSTAYANSVNSVIYFALLPYKLNDPAVNTTYLGTSTLGGEPYHEIEVTFDEQGGGTDYEDRYIYWIHQDTHTMDYLAYRFHVDAGGTRFRKAVHARKQGGIRMQDYLNFGSAEMDHPLDAYDSYFESDTLTKVSEIMLENVRVATVRE